MEKDWDGKGKSFEGILVILGVGVGVGSYFTVFCRVGLMPSFMNVFVCLCVCVL